MQQKRPGSARPYLGGLLLGALGIVAWLWPQPGDTVAPSTPPRTTSSKPSDAHGPPPGGSALDDGNEAARERDRSTIALMVQDMSGRSISGATASLNGRTEVLAASDETGILSLDLPTPSVGEIVVRARGFVPELVALQGLVDGAVVTLRAIPGSNAAFRVVDASAHGIPAVRVIVTSSNKAATPSKASAETDDEGWAVLSGLEAGDYEVSLHLGPFDVSGFVRPQDGQLTVPAPETTVVLSLPNIAWAKPRTGKTVVGYFRVPVGASDFGRTHSFLRRIEEHCERSEPGSIARAFMGAVDDVDLVALFDPGGWTTIRIEPVAMAAEMTPTLLPNPNMEPVPFGNLTVRAHSVRDEPIQAAPFALSLVSASQHGSITFPIDFEASQRLPAGRYVFVALQAGASKLFRGPEHAISVEENGEASVTLQATRPIRRVAVTVEQWTRDAVRLDTLGIVRISDGLGFSTELRPSTESHAWLPTGQTLTARTRLRVGLRYVDLVGDFFVSDTGEERTVLRLQERT
jgi:hypothetical protein